MLTDFIFDEEMDFRRYCYVVDTLVAIGSALADGGGEAAAAAGEGAAAAGEGAAAAGAAEAGAGAAAGLGEAAAAAIPEVVVSAPAAAGLGAGELAGLTGAGLTAAEVAGMEGGANSLVANQPNVLQSIVNDTGTALDNALPQSFLGSVGQGILRSEGINSAKNLATGQPLTSGAITAGITGGAGGALSATGPLSVGGSGAAASAPGSDIAGGLAQGGAAAGQAAAATPSVLDTSTLSNLTASPLGDTATSSLGGATQLSQGGAGLLPGAGGSAATDIAKSIAPALGNTQDLAAVPSASDAWNGVSGAAAPAAAAVAPAAASATPSLAQQATNWIGDQTGLNPSSGVGQALTKGISSLPSVLPLAYEAIAGSQPAKGTNALSSEATQLQQQSAQMENYLNTGTLPPGMQQALSGAAKSAQAAIKSQYANRGMSGSSAEAQDLAAVNERMANQGAQLAMQLYSQGVSEQSAAAQIQESLLNNTLKQDEAFGSAVANFTAALAGGAMGGGGNTITLKTGG